MEGKGRDGRKERNEENSQLFLKHPNHTAHFSANWGKASTGHRAGLCHDSPRASRQSVQGWKSFRRVKNEANRQ